MENKSTPKDVFLHLFSVAALYMAAVAFITLLFQHVNVAFPDELNIYAYESIAGQMRWAMASLIIIFPLYLLSVWMLRKEYAESPEKKDIKIRKWLVYFTLFVAAIVIATDLVTLVYNFLGGELTVRFALKILIILLVAGTVFGYYLLDLKQKLTSRHLKMFAWLVSTAVLIGIVGGFFTAGSPMKARLRKFDAERTNDLQIIQNEIINYWRNKEKLPASLSDLEGSISGFIIPTDPESKMPYEYNILNDLSFELCAEFNMPSSGESAISPKPIPAYPERYYQQNWDHEGGLQCFGREIDPELEIPKVLLRQ